MVVVLIVLMTMIICSCSCSFSSINKNGHEIVTRRCSCGSRMQACLTTTTSVTCAVWLQRLPLQHWPPQTLPALISSRCRAGASSISSCAREAVTATARRVCSQSLVCGMRSSSYRRRRCMCCSTAAQRASCGDSATLFALCSCRYALMFAREGSAAVIVGSGGGGRRGDVNKWPNGFKDLQGALYVQWVSPVLVDVKQV